MIKSTSWHICVADKASQFLAWQSVQVATVRRTFLSLSQPAAATMRIYARTSSPTLRLQKTGLWADIQSSVGFWVVCVQCMWVNQSIKLYMFRVCREEPIKGPLMLCTIIWMAARIQIAELLELNIIAFCWVRVPKQFGWLKPLCYCGFGLGQILWCHACWWSLASSWTGWTRAQSFSESLCPIVWMYTHIPVTYASLALLWAHQVYDCPWL